MAGIPIKIAQPKPNFFEKFGRALGTVAGAVAAPFTGGASLIPTIAAGAGIGGAAGGVVSSLAGKKKDGVGALNSALDGGVGALNAMDRLRQEPASVEKVPEAPKQPNQNSDFPPERALARSQDSVKQIDEGLFAMRKNPELLKTEGQKLLAARNRIRGGYGIG